MRVTAASPEALVYASNQLAMCLAFSAADGQTFVGLNWQDSAGNLYACASWEASDDWIAAAQAPLTRPAWDTDEIIDMTAAEQAQAALVYSTDPTLADPTKLTAIGNMDAVPAITAMGLTAVSSDG